MSSWARGERRRRAHVTARFTRHMRTLGGTKIMCGTAHAPSCHLLGGIEGSTYPGMFTGGTGAMPVTSWRGSMSGFAVTRSAPRRLSQHRKAARASRNGRGSSRAAGALGLGLPRPGPRRGPAADHPLRRLPPRRDRSQRALPRPERPQRLSARQRAEPARLQYPRVGRSGSSSGSCGTSGSDRRAVVRRGGSGGARARRRLGLVRSRRATRGGGKREQTR